LAGAAAFRLVVGGRAVDRVEHGFFHLIARVAVAQETAADRELARALRVQRSRRDDENTSAGRPEGLQPRTVLRAITGDGAEEQLHDLARVGAPSRRSRRRTG
jgi:hypothetical protein